MVEIIPKPIPRSPFLNRILLYFSLAVFLASVAGFFILDNLVKNSESASKKISEALARQKTEEEIKLENDINFAKQRIGYFSQLMNKHISLTDFFPAFEGIWHPKIQISQMSVDPLRAKVIVSGKTESFITLQQQLFSLEKKSEIKSFSLNSFSLSKDARKVDFNLEFSLDPNIFNFEEAMKQISSSSSFSLRENSI